MGVCGDWCARARDSGLGDVGRGCLAGGDGRSEHPSRASACRYTGWVPDDAASWAAQTFTAGVSGSLTDVVMPLRIRTPVVVVAITPVGAGGRPVVSAPLASTSRTGAATA